MCLGLHRQLFARQQLLCYGVEEQFEVELSFLIVISSARYNGVALQRRLCVDYVVGRLAQRAELKAVLAADVGHRLVEQQLRVVEYHDVVEQRLHVVHLVG